jgi:hypothetical protein
VPWSLACRPPVLWNLDTPETKDLTQSKGKKQQKFTKAYTKHKNNFKMLVKIGKKSKKKSMFFMQIPT